MKEIKIDGETYRLQKEFEEFGLWVSDSETEILIITKSGESLCRIEAFDVQSSAFLKIEDC